MVACFGRARDGDVGSQHTSLATLRRPHVEPDRVHMDGEQLGGCSLLIAVFGRNCGQGPSTGPAVEDAVLVTTGKHPLYLLEAPFSLPVAGPSQAGCAEVRGQARWLLERSSEESATMRQGHSKPDTAEFSI